MFIYITYKDAPELSTRRYSDDQDLAVEKTLLVNPDCSVRIMLEYIRKKCRLGIFTSFDLCDESGALKGLFEMPTYTSAKELFVHKCVYYIIVLKNESDRRSSVLPQLNHDNRLYLELKARVQKYLVTPEALRSPSPVTTPPQAAPSNVLKIAPSNKPAKKK